MTKIDPWGGLRLDVEAWACRQTMARAQPPERCGPMMTAAPGRGGFATFQPTVVAPIPGRAEGFEVTPSGYRGRDALRCLDAFDVMAAQARRRGGQAPFTPRQVGIGRDYGRTRAACTAAGFSLSSLEPRSRSGSCSRGGEWIDAQVRDREWLAKMDRRIGGGLALTATRAADAGRRRPISDLQLVELVCVAERSVSEVLKAFGWAVYGERVEGLRGALCRALDRMLGDWPREAQDVG